MIFSKPLTTGIALLQKGMKWWDTYWFSPAPLFNLAICRVIVVAFQIGYLLVRDYHSRLLTQSTIPTVEFAPLPIFQLLNAIFPWDQPPVAVVMAVFYATLVSGVLAVMGWRCRASLAVFALSNLYIQTYLYSFGRVHHSQALMLLALIILVIAPAGKVFSIDDLNRRLKQNTRQRRFQPFNLLHVTHLSARWPLLLVQWLFAIIYFSAGIHKLLPKGSALGLDWLNGYTLQYYLLRDGTQWGSDLGVWLSQFHGAAIAASWFAVLFECTFCLVLLFPRLVWLYVPLGTMLHTGIYMAQRAPFFQFIALYSVFIPWTVAVKRIANWLKWSDENQKIKVFFDGLNPFYIRLMTVLCYFDVFGRIQYQNLTDAANAPRLSEQSEARSNHAPQCSIRIVEPDGAVKEDFIAVCAVTKYVPLLWPIWLLLSLPGTSTVSSKLYQKLAV